MIKDKLRLKQSGRSNTPILQQNSKGRLLTRQLKCRHGEQSSSFHDWARLLRRAWPFNHISTSSKHEKNRCGKPGLRGSHDLW